MARIKFLRRITNRYKKLGGKGGKSKNLKWRKPRGRDNKMRDRRRGYARTVSVGYGNKKNDRGKINGKEIGIVHNISELIKSHSDGKLIVLGKVGMKRKKEIAKTAMEKNIQIYNLNVKKFLGEKTNETK